jgi:hypothetical protein
VNSPEYVPHLIPRFHPSTPGPDDDPFCAFSENVSTSPQQASESLPPAQADCHPTAQPRTERPPPPSSPPPPEPVRSLLPLRLPPATAANDPSRSPSGLSDSFYAVHSSVLAASASSTVSAVDMGGPSSRSTSSPALSGGSAQTLSWDAGGASTSMMAATSAVRGQQDRQSSFASSSIPSSIGREVDVDPLLKRSLVKSCVLSLICVTKIVKRR